MAWDKLRLASKIAPLIVAFICSQSAHKFRSIVHRFTYHAVSKPRNIVIVGGSFTGTYLAKRLYESIPSGYRVILIEKNSHFNYTFNFPRYSVLKGREQKAFIPYTGLLKKSPPGSLEIVRDVVTGVTDGFVSLESGEKVKFSYLAIATGSSQSLPVKVKGTTKAEGREELRDLQSKIEKAKTIAVIGGGAVGVQLSADIKSNDAEKHVTLIHSRDRLLSNFGARLGDFVLDRLRDMGINVVLQERPEIPQARKGEVAFLLKNGEVQTFDLVIPCTGQIPNSQLLSSLSPSLISPQSRRILVKPTLQISDPESSLSHPDIFALGDVAETNGAKMARAGMQQAEITQANILALINGAKRLKDYVPSYAEGALKLSLGKNETVIYIEDGKRDFLIPAKGEGEDLSVKEAWQFLEASMEDCEI